MDLLRLVALDPDDLTILSAQVQDALVRPSDLVWLPGEQRFALELRRFDWESQQSPRRRLAALHFERVGKVRSRGMPARKAETTLNLLAALFHPSGVPDDAGGEIELAFSGGASIRLAVECVEAQLKDLGPVWEAGSLPAHPLDEGST